MGGRGGRGNLSFKTANNTAPTLAERGEAGTETWVDLELKVVADVGIIGIPNAGKSTLLSVVTSAKPKIANYPFTTLVPNLGVCELDYRTTVFADVPGLLEGAHEGLGLGHEFLRHVQRCRALVHVVDGTSPDPVGDFRAINLELELFNPELRYKPQLVAYNKIDVPDSGDFWEVVREELMADGIPAERIFAVSAVSGKGVTDLVRSVRRMLDDMGPPEDVYETNALNLSRAPKKKDVRMDEFTVDMEEDIGGARSFFVEGEAIQKFAQVRPEGLVKIVAGTHCCSCSLYLLSTLREKVFKWRNRHATRQACTIRHRMALATLLFRTWCDIYLHSLHSLLRSC